MTERRGRTVSWFLACGAAAALVNWLARIGLSPWMSFEGAVVVAYGLAMIVAFTLYRTLVWPGGPHSLARQLGGFLVVNGIGAAVVFVTALAARAGLALSPLPTEFIEAFAHGLGIAVAAGVNFIAHARVTFGAPARG